MSTGEARRAPHWLVATLSAIMVIACILWNLETPTRLGFAVLSQQYMALQLGLAIAIVFLHHGADLADHPLLRTGNRAVAVVALAVLGYAAWDFSWLLQEQAYRPWQITLIGTVVTITVMEGIRRRAGWMLFLIVGAFVVYALFADKVPGRLIGKELSPERLVQYVGFDPNAVFSTPLAVGTMIVLLFVFFGQLLFAAGGGAFFTDLAMAMTGRSRGGSAKISVVGSAMFGSISGSAVSNVVTTGVITIPLMKRGGYSGRDAGAIEAVASTGGQLTPPIMGAAAFLMAEFLDIPYLAVTTAALLPAVLYYASVFLQVDLIAGRDGVVAGGDDIPQVGEVLKSGWHFVIPFALLLIALFYWRMDPEDSALLASVAIVVVGFLRSYRGKRLSVTGLGRVFVDTGITMVDLILVVAAAGFVIGILNITGLGFALTLVLVDVVGGNVVPLLLVAAFVCVLLGMGMPTSGVYVLLAALVAPSLVEAGITPIAAHLFILYFGMMSMITPPVALAAFAAAAITRESQLGTGVAALRTGWAAFFIPFLFVSSPALLLDAGLANVISAMLLSLVGIAAVSAAIVGYWGTRLPLVARAGFLLLGLLALPIGFLQLPMAAHGLSAAALVAVGLWKSRQARQLRQSRQGVNT